MDSKQAERKEVNAVEKRETTAAEMKGYQMVAKKEE